MTFSIRKKKVGHNILLIFHGMQDLCHKYALFWHLLQILVAIFSIYFSHSFLSKPSYSVSDKEYTALFDYIHQMFIKIQLL